MNYANPQSIHWATLSFFIHLGKLTQRSFLVVVVGFYSVYFICWFSIGRARWAIHQQLQCCTAVAFLGAMQKLVRPIGRI
jgi:hypothetical protein